MSTSLVERDALVGNLLDKVDDLERRVRYMEDTHPGVGGEAAGKLAYYREDGSLHLPGLVYSEENAVWGYYDRYVESVYVANAAAGVNTLDFTAVPAGEVWVVTGMSFADVNTAANVNAMANLGGTNTPVSPRIALTAGFFTATAVLNVVLKAGDFMRATFDSCVLNDDLYAYAWGYKMKVA